jgi:hypothetical protein
MLTLILTNSRIPMSLPTRIKLYPMLRAAPEYVWWPITRSSVYRSCTGHQVGVFSSSPSTTERIYVSLMFFWPRLSQRRNNGNLPLYVDSTGYLRSIAPDGNRAPFKYRAWWGTLPQNPQNLTNFGLSGRELAIGGKTNACKRKAKQQCLSSLPIHASFSGITFGGGVQRSIVPCFPLCRLDWSELTKNTSHCGGQAVRPISTNFFLIPSTTSV